MRSYVRGDASVAVNIASYFVSSHAIWRTMLTAGQVHKRMFLTEHTPIELRSAPDTTNAPLRLSPRRVGAPDNTHSYL